jgi:hypothetical protein
MPVITSELQYLNGVAATAPQYRLKSPAEQENICLWRKSTFRRVLGHQQAWSIFGSD